MGTHYTVTADGLNIRDAPSSAAGKRGCLRKQFVVAVSAEKLSRPGEGHGD
jgi:hypothetical protein